MAAFGALAIAQLGAVTAPTSLRMSTPAAATTGLVPWGLYDAFPIPSINAVVFCHPVEHMRYAIDGASYRLGLLAPPEGLTAVSTAAKATAVLTTDAAATNFANNDQIQVGYPGMPGVGYITFKTTLDATSVSNQVKIGATKEATIQNLEKLIEGNGQPGVDYYSYMEQLGDPSPRFDELGKITVSATSIPGGASAATITFQATEAGPQGNLYNARIVVDTGTMASFGTGSVFTGGAGGTGTAPAADTYLYSLQHLRNADGALSGASEPFVEMTQETAANVTLDNFPAVLTRDGTDFYRINRTLGSGRVLHRLSDASADPVTDSTSDDVLADKTLLLKYDARIFRTRLAGYPQVGRFGVVWRGRLWTAGALKAGDYTLGTASVTNGSASVTMSAACRAVKEDVIGKTFKVTGDTVDYLVVDTDTTSNIVKLNKEYQGTTAAAANYTLRDARDPYLLQYSEPKLYNNFPAGNSLTGVTGRDTLGVTGLRELDDSLIVYTTTDVWRVTGDTGSFVVRHVGGGMGCFSNRAIQVVGGVAYWIGPDGVWGWDGRGTPLCLSKPSDSEPLGIQGTIERLNCDEGEIVVSNYNPSSQKIRWWIPLDGELANRYCLRLNLQTGGFALQTASDVTAACTVPGPDGRFLTLIGDAHGCIWQLDAGYSDGAYGFEPKCVVSSYTAATRTLAITGTTLPTTGDALKGVPGVVINQTTGAYQRFKVESNTSGAAVLTEALTTAPSASDIVIFGGYPYDLVSTRFDSGHPEILKWVEGATVPHLVESVATEVWCGVGADNDDPEVFTVASTVDYANLTDADGEKHYWLYSEQGRTHTIRFLAFVRGYRVHLRPFTLSMRSPHPMEVEG